MWAYSQVAQQEISLVQNLKEGNLNLLVSCPTDDCLTFLLTIKYHSGILNPPNLIYEFNLIDKKLSCCCLHNNQIWET